MKQLISASLCMMLIGCASVSTQRLTEDTLTLLDGKSVTLVPRKSPSFVAMTSGKGMFAVAGVGAAAAAGNNLVQEKQIEDPAVVIGESFAQDLQSRHGVKVAGHSLSQADSADIGEIVKLAEGSDYALDVATNGWSYMYDGFKFSDYFVGYSSKMRLIDVATRNVVASGFCIYDAKKAGKIAVSHDRLMENDAAYIKQELADAADLCVQQFKSEIL